MRAVERKCDGRVDAGAVRQSLEQELPVSFPPRGAEVVGAQRREREVVRRRIGDLVTHFQRIVLQGGAGEVAARQLEKPTDFRG